VLSHGENLRVPNQGLRNLETEPCHGSWLRTWDQVGDE